MKKTCIRNILMILLVINFIALIISLTNLVAGSPLRDYRLALVISFIVIAFFAQKKCSQAKENEEDSE